MFNHIYDLKSLSIEYFSSVQSVCLAHFSWDIPFLSCFYTISYVFHKCMIIKLFSAITHIFWQTNLLLFNLTQLAWATVIFSIAEFIQYLWFTYYIPNKLVVVVELLNCMWLSCYPMDHSPPGSSVHKIFKAQVLEWIAISISIYS